MLTARPRTPAGAGTARHRPAPPGTARHRLPSAAIGWPRSEPSTAPTPVFTRIDVRDGKVTDVGHHPPFGLLGSANELEHGDVVGKTISYSNLPELRKRLARLPRLPVGRNQRRR